MLVSVTKDLDLSEAGEDHDASPHLEGEAGHEDHTPAGPEEVCGEAQGWVKGHAHG